MGNHDMHMAGRIEADRRILELLSQTFPTQDSASTEIINLEAILRLPKGTEHFVADIHGEHEAFQHILKNASGNIRRKVNELFQDTLEPEVIKELCTLIYYPEEKLELIEAKDEDSDCVRIVIGSKGIRISKTGEPSKYQVETNYDWQSDPDFYDCENCDCEECDCEEGSCCKDKEEGCCQGSCSQWNSC